MSTPTAPATPAASTTPAAPATPTAPATTPPAPASTPPAPATPPVPATPPAAPQGGEPQDVASLPAWAQKLITDTRAEAASYRTRAQTAEQGTPPTAPAPAAPTAPPADAPEGDVSRLPQWAQRAITDGQTAGRRAAVQAAIIQAAPGAGADVARLLDSQSFAATVATVDPTDTAAITQAITNAVTAQPWLSAHATGPARGGADFGGTGAGEVTPAQFAAMSYAERVALHQSDPDTYRRLAGS
ncbi:hypothetical protein F7R91_32760 [Streptomyces luteolifulvus]|uniref:Uncharacterized protein n=1 Tax=Streptomyces luteolifulvus TaxID=2615112 RepID=A0A6H9US47_9ACTN|nr:hypothetical protein [Streptomyces luteolifulvus]KAB1141398.1 hypothetical protein F7R91_32760 [Streptomyces luteolifulvus]